MIILLFLFVKKNIETMKIEKWKWEQEEADGKRKQQKANNIDIKEAIMNNKKWKWKTNSKRQTIKTQRKKIKINIKCVIK